MKNIKHHTIAITASDKVQLEALRGKVINIYKEKMEAKKGFQLVSPIIESLINNFCTFYIAPDGSKEGYDASDDGDIIRKSITTLIESYKQADGENPFRYVEIAYGADDNSSQIISHN